MDKIEYLDYLNGVRYFQLLHGGKAYPFQVFPEDIERGEFTGGIELAMVIKNDPWIGMRILSSLRKHGYINN